jgi:hypothetical protein
MTDSLQRFAQSFEAHGALGTGAGAGRRTGLVRVGHGVKRATDSVGQLDCWIQVMNLCFITLGDE